MNLSTICAKVASVPLCAKCLLARPTQLCVLPPIMCAGAQRVFLAVSSLTLSSGGCLAFTGFPIACRGKAQLADLEALQEEAETLPAWVPEVKRINTVVQKAHDWLAKSRSMMSTRAPLKRMRDLLHSGTRLAVVVPEVEALRLEIRKREWCDAVKMVHCYSGSLVQTAAWENELPGLCVGLGE